MKKKIPKKFIRKLETKKDYLKLIDEINEHDIHYYVECKPVISDYEYDFLVKQLEEFEKKHPSLISENSPTKRIGEVLTTGFKSERHSEPMLSLTNTYSREEVFDFVKRVYKILGKKDIFFCLELKIDGAAVALRYENGFLKKAITRGNGYNGDDITSNVKTIRSLPLKLQYRDLPKSLEIRGEVFIHKKTFQELNKKREEEGKEVFANPRNAAAGTLKLLDPKEVSKRKLNILCYGILDKGITIDDKEIISQYEVHKIFKKLKIPVAKEEYFYKTDKLEEIFLFADKINGIRKNLSFEIDGIVIKVDDLKYHKRLGATGKSPRFAVAYKFSPEQAYTKIKDITVQVGRTGVLTPVAELKSTFLAGSTISRATLHNQDEIKRKDIRINDYVIIEKGGDVIPKVVSVDLKKRSKDAKIWHMPKRCPICKSEVIHIKGEVAVRCPNNRCIGRRIRRLSFFASKAAMDINHMGKKVVEKLVEKGLISKPSDIYLLTKEDISQIEGFKEKSIKNLLDSIEVSKKIPLWRFILGLEIKYVGKETAILLSEEVKNIQELIKIKKEDLLEVEGIGEKVADSVIAYFKDEDNIKEIEKLLIHGVSPTAEKKKKLHHIFSKKVFVLTGALKKYTRDEASWLIKERGGKTSSSVSKNTDFLLVGENPGSKYEKAKKLNVKIITEKEFEKML